MLETTRIRREGYSFRPTFADFMERFGILAYGPSQRVQPSSETCRHVLNKSGVAGWLVGHTKVFLKYWQVEQLDKSIKLFHDHAKTFQKVSRGFLARMYVDMAGFGLEGSLRLPQPT
jgi:myosin-3